jgi:hypothetical protein
LGIEVAWHDTVVSRLEELNINVNEALYGKFRLLVFEYKTLVVHLISLNSNHDAAVLINLQAQYSERGVNLIHLWEDVWAARQGQVLSRIQSLLGLNQRIHARKTKVISVSKPLAEEFLEANHIQSYASSRYRVGLKLDEKLVALACFSNLRVMKKEGVGTYKSAEVIRFASLAGYTVMGGFTKLLKHFIAKFGPDDIMSYADRDWSNGKVYEQAGFELVDITPPSIIYLKTDTLVRYFPHRLPSSGILPLHNVNNNTNFVEIFNTGNLKYIYTI